MNRQRRRLLNQIYMEMVEMSRYIEKDNFFKVYPINIIIWSLNNIKKKLEDVYTDEEYSFNDRSEGSQATWSGQESEEAIECMDNAIDHLNNVIDALEQSKTFIDDNEYMVCHETAIDEMDSALDELFTIDIY